MATCEVCGATLKTFEVRAHEQACLTLKTEATRQRSALTLKTPPIEFTPDRWADVEVSFEQDWPPDA